MIYFIRCTKFVKIGISADPKDRMFMFQAYNPMPLELMLQIPVWFNEEYKLEIFLHVLFKDLKQHGEWFRYEYPLSDFIRTFKALNLPNQEDNSALIRQIGLEVCQAFSEGVLIGKPKDIKSEEIAILKYD